MNRQEQRQQVYRGCIVLFSIVGCVFLWAAVLSFDATDWPSNNVWPHPEPSLNACGRAGAWLAHGLFYYFGDGTYPLAMGLALAAVLLAWRGRIPCFWQRVFGISLLVSVTSISVYLVGGQASAALPEAHGGILGIAAGHWLRANFSLTGTILILGYCFFVGVAFTAEGLVLRAPDALRHVGRVSGQALTAARGRLPLPAMATATATPAPTTTKRVVRADTDKASTGTLFDTDEDEEEDETLTDEADDDTDTEEAEGEEEEYDEDDEDDDEEDEEEDDEDDEDWDEDEDEDEADAAKPRPPVKVINRRPEVLAARGQEQALPTQPYPKELGEWEFPPLSLLSDPEYLFTAQQESIVREKARILERTLEEFRLEAHVVEIDTGPVITMFELQLAPGIKVSQIASLANDIARSLKAPAVRVVAPIPGKNTVGIEVPNLEKETVRVKELATLAGHRVKGMALPLFIGKDASGNALVADLATMPHMLIAGTTGSGKSVCINTIIVSLLMTRRPDMVKLILVDPKMVEMSQFKSIPHLMCPIITDMARAEKILDWATTKMDERYELLAEAGVRNLAAFNRLSKEEIYARFQPSNEDEKAKIPTHLPHIVIIIDELADLMMQSAKEVEQHLSRLAQKSRAVGIHIIVATQRPEARIVTGLIKSNLPCRIAFRVASRMDSRIVLDQNGAEVLMGQGDMLYLPPGSAKLVRAQGTYLDDTELRNIIQFLAEKGEPEFHPELIRMRSDDSMASGERDPLFDDAVRIILETKRGSVSLLQRRLTIGYSRASRLIDQMATAGIVGDYKGSQAREVTMTLDEWESFRHQVQHEVQNEGYAADQDDDDVPDLIDDASDIRD